MNFKAEGTSESAAQSVCDESFLWVTAGLDTGTPLKQPRGLGALRKCSSPWVSRMLGESEQDEKPTENCSGCGAAKILWIFLCWCFSLEESK